MNASVDELLRGLPLLRSLPRRELEQLPFDRIERADGEAFFHQGDVADAVYGVVTGRVRIVKRTPSGREMALEVLGPGDAVAAVAVIRKVPMPAGCFALEPTALVRVPAAPFLDLVARHPALGTRLLDVISRRLLDAGTSRVTLAAEPVEVRLAQALLHLSRRFGADRAGEVVFTQAFTRHNLAEMAGTTVESAIRTMSRWTREGILRSQDARITILQPDVLRRLAGV